MRLLQITALLSLLTSVGYSQDYIVTIKGDTIRGEVRVLSYDLIDRVQLVDGKKKTTYTAVQVRLASVKSELYAPVKYDNTIRLMKILKSGFLSLYAFRFPNQIGYDGQLLIKLGTAAQEVPNIGFKRYVGNLVEDCPTVAEKVKSGDFDRNNVPDLVDEYNQCIAKIQEDRFNKVVEKNSTPTGDFINEMKERVSKSDLTTKTEVTDLLNSIAEKVQKNEPVPAYMKEGLKGYLSQRDDFKEDTEQLLKLLEK